MASLRQEHHYGLSSGKTNRNTRSKTLYHVKLTDTAIRALESYQNLKESLPSQPTICFKGNQGFIKIPAPAAETAETLRLFSFYLSSDSKDQPQASFDCIHQYVSREGREQLEGQGSIQDKITVCATDDSYQMTRERVSQVEKDSWSRSAIEIKPGATYPNKCVKFPKRPVPYPATAPPPDHGLLKHSPPNRRAPGPPGAPGVVTQRPLKERVIHLLALKPYRKPELLLWLDRERAPPRDKADLGPVLDEVARLSAKDSGYLLRDDFYRLVQKDWPGYSEEERQLLGRLLARKMHMQNISQSRTSLPSPSLQKASENPTQNPNASKNRTVKRPVPSDPQDSGALKKPRLVDGRLVDGRLVDGRLADGRLTDARLAEARLASDVRLRPPLPVTSTTNITKIKSGLGQTPAVSDPSFHTKTEIQATTAQSQVVAGQNGFPIVHKLFGSPLEPDARKEGPTAPIGLQGAGPDAGQPQTLACNQHKKKKSKKHKDKERERLKDKEERPWIESSLDKRHSGQDECQRQRLPGEGRLLQAGTEGLARLLRGGETAAGQTPGQNHQVPSDPQDCGLLNRPRLVDARLADARLTEAKLAEARLAEARLSSDMTKINAGLGPISPVSDPSYHTKTEIQATTAQSQVVAGQNGFPIVHKLFGSPLEPTKPEARTASPTTPIGHQGVGQHKKKSKKERERLKDKEERTWIESSPEHKQSLEKLHDPEIINAVPSEEKPDYVLKYPSIVTLEQREGYQTDFCSEYSEYIDLHSRIATITHMFVQLASKIKSLSPGTQQYKIMEDQIMEKYKKYRNKFPGYRQEKKRCEYLHEKLSHIKQLITDYDVTQTSTSS
ncbi:unnamed protein product [Gadus morhua 'NCC']